MPDRETDVPSCLSGVIMSVCVSVPSLLSNKLPRQIDIDQDAGVIGFENLKSILYFARGREFRPADRLAFLDNHVSEWRPRPIRSRCIMKSIMSTNMMDDTIFTTWRHRPHGFGVFMHHMQSFTSLTQEDFQTKSSPIDGFQCQRQSFNLKSPYTNEALRLREVRYSICLNFWPVQRPCGLFTLVSLADQGSNENKRRNTPGADASFESRHVVWKRYGLFPAGLYTGISVFQLQICAFIDFWEDAWNITIAKIDATVSVPVSFSVGNQTTVNMACLP